MSGFNIDDYKTVPERIAEFKAIYPHGSLQPADRSKPYAIENVGDVGAMKTFIVYAAAAYRTPDDPCPGIGVAWEPFPGRTPYTRDSELQNAETSAWGRAIVAALASDTSKGVASREEVQTRREEPQDRLKERRDLLVERVKLQTPDDRDAIKAKYKWPWDAKAMDQIEATLA